MTWQGLYLVSKKGGNFRSIEQLRTAPVFSIDTVDPSEFC